MDRIILHVDLDAFYASLEELRRPEIRGKPVVVCVYSGRTEDSGAVSTSNYKARELGIRAGMPIAFAKRAANGKDVVFLPVDMEYYRSVSERIMSIMEEYADRMQQVSIDEAYIDVSDTCPGDYSCAEEIAKKIKKDIREQEGVTCSVGIGPNKYVAKMASKHQKPDGLTVVRQEEVRGFLKDLPVGKLHGIGGKTEEALNDLGIMTAGDLAGFDPKKLVEAFGENKAKLLKEKSLGIDDSPVEQQEKKQLSRIATLKENIGDVEEIFAKIKELAEDLKKRIDKMHVSFRTVSIITIDTRLQMQTKSETIEETDDLDLALPAVKNLLVKFFSDNPGRELRRVGIRVSNLSHKNAEKKQRTLSDY